MVEPLARKNTTFQRSTVSLISATRESSSGAARSTPVISAPMCPATGLTATPAMRSGRSAEVLSVVMCALPKVVVRASP